MADELPDATSGGNPPPPASPTGAATPANQLQPSGDRLAAILAKKAAGETLSASDRGYLGAVKRRGTPKKVVASTDENLLLQPPPPVAKIPLPAENPLFDDSAAADVSADALARPAIDANSCQMAADALLDGLDGGTKMWVGYECGKANFDRKTAEQYESAVALHPRNRELMVKNSEPVVLFLCKWFKCSPEQLPEALKKCGFVAGMVAHGMAVAAAIKSIRESKQEKTTA